MAGSNNDAWTFDFKYRHFHSPRSENFRNNLQPEVKLSEQNTVL